MGIRSVLSKPFARYIVKQQRRWAANPGQSQQKIFEMLMQNGRKTTFGNDHHLPDVRDHASFQEAVPVRDYEGLKSYFDQVVEGKPDILWPGKPAYFAKTSGTTSGTKYIPITRASIPNHINSARNALLNYIDETGNSQFIDGNLIFLSGSPEMTKTAGIHTGRLSGIVNHHVPGYLRTNQMPSYETNCIEDWEQKVEHIIDETLSKNMTLISGIPPWVQMYFDRIIERTGKSIMEVFPNFSLFVYGGVNFEPYRKKLTESIGREVDSIETYPASEGFIAYQDSQEQEGLLMLLDSGIFYEFIPAEEYFSENPTRLTITEVQKGVNYAVVMSSNAGLWGYSIGDTVEFVSLEPYRVLVTGRIKHFISAFGEHVIGQEVENAMRHTMEQYPEVELVEFSVAPQVNPDTGLPLHEWYVEFRNQPSDLIAFQKDLDLQLQKLNAYYEDLIQGKILRPLEIRLLKENAFRDYMKSLGKLGGQNKVPRLANDRKIAQAMQTYLT